MLNLSHVICLYVGVILGWFLASLCFVSKKDAGYKKNTNGDID
jgi:uncharacterized protein YneF (UPF0154 family)